MTQNISLQQLKASITQALQQLIDWNVNFADTDNLSSFIKDVRIDKDDRDLLENALVKLNAFNLLQQASSKNSDVIDRLADRMKYVDKSVARVIIERIAVMLVGFHEPYNSTQTPPSTPPKPTVIQPTPITQSQQLQTDGFCINCGTPRIVGAAFCASCSENLSSIQLADLHKTRSITPPPPKPLKPIHPPSFSAGIATKIRIGEKRNLDFGNYKWRVLDVQGNKVLLITEDVVIRRRFDPKSNDWEKSEIKKQYLDNEFYSKFDSECKSKIDGSAFLLSVDEARKYFKDDEDRKALHDGKACWWWLRSPGLYSFTASSVLGDGYVRVGGSRVDGDYGGVRPALWLNL
jgi:hypothetical protein